MKKIILIAASVISSACVFAQAAEGTVKTTVITTTKTDSIVTKTEVKKVPAKGSYRCVYGDYVLPVANQCPTHKLALVKDGHYYCMHYDGGTSDKPGKCSICKTDMVQMVPPPAEIKKEEIKEADTEKKAE